MKIIISGSGEDGIPGLYCRIPSVDAMDERDEQIFIYDHEDSFFCLLNRSSDSMIFLPAEEFFIAPDFAWNHSKAQNTNTQATEVTVWLYNK